MRHIRRRKLLSSGCGVAAPSVKGRQEEASMLALLVAESKEHFQDV